MSSSNKRRYADVMELMMKGYVVELINDRYDHIIVELHGPKESPYEGGVWNVRVLLEDYPYQSPSIGFVNKIFHPNVEESDGSVCLDAIDKKWSELYTLLKVFEIILPQFLLDPNPFDPLNIDAASLMISDKEQYERKVREYCELYAKRELTDEKLTHESEGEPSDDEALSDKQSESDVGEASDDETLIDKQNEDGEGESSDDEALGDEQRESGDDIADP